MKRREFLRNTTATAAGSMFIPQLRESDMDLDHKAEFDKFGGDKRISSKKTGYFHTEKIEEKWWLITPEGNGFLISGCNHINHNYVQQGYNKEQWGEMAQSREKFYNYVVEDMKAWNMSTIGYGDDFEKPVMPYVKPCRFPAVNCWNSVASFPDVFSEKFARECDEIARKNCESRKDDPYLIGYLFCDVPEWPVPGRVSKRRPFNWIDDLKRKGADSPGKQAYVRLMQNRYSKISDFNRVYGTDFSQFSDILKDQGFVFKFSTDPEMAREDDKAFTDLLIRKYYEVVVGAVRRYDQDHMLLGEICEGNRGVHPTVLSIAKHYVSILSIQYYGVFKDQYEHLKEWNDQTNLPILIADSCFGVPTEKMPRPCGTKVDNEKDRAFHFENYATQAFGQSFIIGWLWCGYIDAWKEKEDRLQHTGLKDIYGKPYEPITRAMQKVYGSVMDIHKG